MAAGRGDGEDRKQKEAKDSDKVSKRDAGNQSVRSARSEPAKKQANDGEQALYVDTQWPISTLMKVNEVPYQMLMEFSALFKSSYMDREFQETLSILSSLATQERITDLGNHVHHQSVASNHSYQSKGGQNGYGTASNQYNSHLNYQHANRLDLALNDHPDDAYLNNQ